MRRTLFTFLSAIALVATGVVGAIAVGGTGVVDPPPRIAFLANGIVPADALAAGGIAGQLGAPLFTTRADVLEQAAEDGIVDHDPDLVIAIGGEVAINQSVLDALAAATGLSMTTAEAPTDGIVRVGGGTRFDTAVLVGELLAAYSPAYLPVDATALGAIDAATADMADDSDKLDGMDSTDFALSDQACDAGQVVSGIAADGTPTCVDNGSGTGDGSTTYFYNNWTGASDGLNAPKIDVRQSSSVTALIDQPGDGGSFAILDASFPVSIDGSPAVEVLDITLCLREGADDLLNVYLDVFDINANEPALFTDLHPDAGYANDTCTTITPSRQVVLDTTRRMQFYVGVSEGTTVSVTAAHIRVAPSSDPVIEAES